MKTNAHKEFSFTEKQYADEFQQYCEKELLTTKRFSETEVSVAIYENEPETIDIADDKYYDIKIEMFIASIEAYMSEKPVFLYRGAERRKGQLEGLAIAQKRTNIAIAVYRTDKDLSKFLRTINQLAYNPAQKIESWPFVEGFKHAISQKKAGLREILEDFEYDDCSIDEE